MAEFSIPWDIIENKCHELSEKLMDTSLSGELRVSLRREYVHLDRLVRERRGLVDLHTQLRAVEEALAQEADQHDEMAVMLREEAERFRHSISEKEKQIEHYIAPTDEHDDRAVYLEVRAGTGGQEAALFAGDLLNMYTAYALRKGWKVTLDSSSSTELGGYREAVLYIRGSNVYGDLKRESGVHRVQRVPQTETSGRVHTSTATVAVLPEADDVDVKIDPSDLRIDVYRSSGAGGQHVNTTDSAVRITHIPTNVVVSCQEERSQHKNKAKAMKRLQSRLLAASVEAQAAAMSEQRKQQVGAGTRSEKIRTYNFPQNRVTDHQVEITLKKLDRVMQGDLDDIIEALTAESQETRRRDFLAKLGVAAVK